MIYKKEINLVIPRMDIFNESEIIKNSKWTIFKEEIQQRGRTRTATEPNHKWICRWTLPRLKVPVEHFTVLPPFDEPWGIRLFQKYGICYCLHQSNQEHKNKNYIIHQDNILLLISFFLGCFIFYLRYTDLCRLKSSC